MKVPWYFVLSFLIFCFEPTVREDTWMRSTFNVVVIFFKSSVLKVTWSQTCSKFFPNNFEANQKRHLRDTLQLTILRKWININVLILSWLNNMKWKLKKVPRKLSVSQKTKPVYRRTLHEKKMTFHLFLYASFSLK